MAAAPDPEEILRSTSGKENFQRITRLLISGGTSLLREIFDSRCPPSQLPTILSNPATKNQLKAAKLTKAQRHCLNPSPGVYGNSADFDVTLLFSLLRTICSLTPPTTGWDALPVSTDHSLTADLARIKYYRNSVYGHVNQGMAIRDSGFLTLWQEISEALVRIAGQISSTRKTAWQEAIAKYLTDPLTTEDERNVQELDAWYKSDVDVKQSLKDLEIATQEESKNIKEFEETTRKGIDRIESAVREEAQGIKEDLKTTTHNVTNMIEETVCKLKDQLEEMNQSITTLSSSASGSESSGALLTLLIDCLAIHERGTQRGATGMIETPQESQGVMQGGADAPGTSILQETSARTNFQGENVRKEGFPAPQDVLTLISTMYLKSIKPSTLEEFNAFIVYMEKVRQVIVVDKKSGSLKIILECTSLEILDELWQDYCTGNLGKVVQAFLVTEDILKKLGLTEVKLTTTIEEEEYRTCREYFCKQEVDREQQITIKAMSGEIIVLKVKPRDSVKEMKIKISETQGFPPSQQRLIFRWKKLEDHCTLSDYGVNEESTLYSPVHLVVRLRLPQKPPMAVSVQTMTGKTIKLEVEPKDSIDSVKTTIQEILGLPPDQQILFFNNKPLKNYGILSDYNIQHESTLFLLSLIFVKLQSGKTISLPLYPGCTVEDIKQLIQNQEGILPEQQRLTFEGKELESDATLEYYNILSNLILDQELYTTKEH